MSKGARKVRLFLWIGAVWPLAVFGQSAASTGHIYMGQTPSNLRVLFQALGNRLEVSGKERLTLSGALTQGTRKTPTQSAQIVIDIGGMLRMDTGTDRNSVVFDGSQLQVTSGAPGQADQDLVNTFVQDSMESFLQNRVQGMAVRTIALRAKAKDPENTGAVMWCDLYQAVIASQGSPKSAPQVKTYCFDSTSHLMRSVSYHSGTGSVTTVVETRFSDWRSIDASGQMAPWKIERYENGSPALSFTAQSAALGATAADSVFKKP